MTLSAAWSYPTDIRFGAGRIAELPKVCQRLGMQRPLFVTDSGLADFPMVRDAVAACADAGLGIAVFSDVKSNPIDSNVADGVTALKNGDHDGVIAFGGGSALDVGKAIAFMAGQTRPIWDFEAIDGYSKRANVDGILPIIAVPTTAGTGSEVGRASVIGNSETHTKTVIYHPNMMPAVVISDAELTVGLPANLTAWTGMDAMAHCLEAFCAPGFHPMADGIALEGLRLVRMYLSRAVNDGTDIEARSGMLAAASMGATAFQKGLGAIHSLSHPIGALYDMHHGLSNAIFMPYVIRFNRPAIEPAMKRLAQYVGLPKDSYKAVLDWSLELRSEFGIPHTLQAAGIEDKRFEQLSVMAENDPTAPGNPIPIKAADCHQLYEDSYSGNL